MNVSLTYPTYLKEHLMKLLGPLVWSALVEHQRAISTFTPAQTNRTKTPNELKEAVVKTLWESSSTAPSEQNRTYL